MKINYQPSRDTVANTRRAAYLKAWPVEKQMEALAEKEMGRPEKLEQMLRDFAEIRQKHPYSEEDSNVV